MVRDEPSLVGWSPHLMDVAMVVGMLGLLVAGTAVRLSRVALYPLQDPRLTESLEFENV